MKTKLYYFPLFLSLTAVLISCGGQSNQSIYSRQDGPPSQYIDVSTIPDAVPQRTQRTKYGNPTSYVVFGKRYHVMSSSQGYKERGVASWYGSKFHGRRTSSGEAYDMHAMTAAHKTLPLPTYVKVTNLKNGRQVVVKVNDRGPFHNNRIIDLSHTAAVKLGIKGTGTGLVEVETIEAGNKLASSQPVETSSAPKEAIYPSAQNTISESSVGLFLQLGAFVSSQNAHNLKNKVNSSIESNKANVSSTLKNEQQYFRVRIGPLSAVEQADELAQTLAQKGFEQPRIVIE